MTKFKFIDLFSGVGGFHYAMKSLGGECVFAADIDKWAIETYKTNFGMDSHCDVSKVDADDIPDHDVLCAGFSCFPAGTLVMTDHGMVPIEDIKIGDMVLTHKGRYRRVLNTMVQESNALQKIKVTGCDYIYATPNHPFYAYENTKCEPNWKDVSSLTKKDKVGYTFNQENITIDTDNHSVDFWYMVGRFVGDGHCTTYPRKGRKHSNAYRIGICCGKSEKDEMISLFDKCGYHYSIWENRTTFNFLITSKDLCEYLMKCGHSAKNKCVHPDVWKLPLEKKKSFLEGYFSADGCYYQKDDVYQFTSISKKLLYEIKLLVLEVYGKTCTFSKLYDEHYGFIENRKVHINEAYNLKYKNNPDKNHRYNFVQDNIAWSSIKSNETIEYENPVLVYNFEVEEDHSYTADTIIVHNCQPFSVGGQRLGFEDSRGTLFFHIARILKEKKTPYIFLENVKGLLSHDEGRTWEVIHNTLIDLGYVLTEEPTILSPHYLGIPQNRERILICGVHKDEIARNPSIPVYERNGEIYLDLKYPKKEDAPVTSCYSILEDLTPKDAAPYMISEYEDRVLSAWDEFHHNVNTNGYHGTILYDEFGGTYDIESSDAASWKRPCIRRSREVYLNNKTFIDAWSKKWDVDGFKLRDKHFEWHSDADSVWDTIVQFRQSGVRFSNTITYPALVAIVQTPVVAKYRRRLTPRECARLQSLPEDFKMCSNERQAYKQFGNGVNVDVVKFLAEQYIKPIDEQ